MTTACFYCRHSIDTSQIFKIQFQFGSLWPNDAIWRHRFGSTSAEVMVCCLPASSTNVDLNQWDSVAFTLDQFHRKCSRHLNYILRLFSHLPGGNELNRLFLDPRSRCQSWSWISLDIFQLMVSMMTSPNGNIFRLSSALCGEFTGCRWIPVTKASDAELGCFFICLNKRLSKQPRRRWSQTPSRSLWRHYNG